ncbi:MAG: hypothetical protein JXA90_08260 [Planctomycetes bacterium]|nr:hypothetical protein [Planctomycetota bacterium]
MMRDLDQYANSVQHPGVSGFEHIETLEIRDRLSLREHDLSEEDRECLRRSDSALLRNVDQIAAALSQVTNLADERTRRQPSARQWWWFLDVLSEVASVASTAGES